MLHIDSGRSFFYSNNIHCCTDHRRRGETRKRAGKSPICPQIGANRFVFDFEVAMATIKDVARLAGVSPSTVSKYINGGNVRREKIGSIQQAIEALDYRVNPFGRSLKTQRSRSIGILLPDLTVSFFGTVFMAVDKVLREHGYHGISSCYYYNHGLERDCLSFLIGTGIDGLIYVPEFLTAEECMELTAYRGIPMVQVDRTIPGLDADAVLTDNVESVYKAVSHLIGRGHRRIAIIGGPSSSLTARERMTGYLRALEDHGILYDDSLVVSGDYTFATGYHGFQELMAASVPPTAIFSTNYDITTGLITIARERGYRIPEDIDVFGYDCVDICRMMTPPLPVVHQPEREIGRIAANYLMERLEGYRGEARLTRLACELLY